MEKQGEGHKKAESREGKKEHTQQTQKKRKKEQSGQQSQANHPHSQRNLRAMGFVIRQCPPKHVQLIGEDQHPQFPWAHAPQHQSQAQKEERQTHSYSHPAPQKQANQAPQTQQQEQAKEARQKVCQGLAWMQMQMHWERMGQMERK
jgi:hypothetical protein